MELQDLSRVTKEELALVPSPATGTPGALTAPREFNLMFQTNVGAMAVRGREMLRDGVGMCVGF